MKELSGKQFKKLLLDNLKNFDSFCKANNIAYFLMFGTLLGAVRHKGFIPWDDDIDLMIPRADYEKLIKIFNQKNSRYQLVSYETNNEFTAPLAKVIDTKTLLIQNYGYKEKVELGVYLDLFVLDGLPSDIKQQKKHIKTAYKYIRKWVHANHQFHYKNNSIFKDILRFIYYLPSNIIGYKYYLNKIIDNCKKYNYDESKYVACISYFYRNPYIFLKEYFDVEFIDFENIKCPIPREYNKILEIVYGNWRELPPIEKRVSHHDYNCYMRY